MALVDEFQEQLYCILVGNVLDHDCSSGIASNLSFFLNYGYHVRIHYEHMGVFIGNSLPFASLIVLVVLVLIVIVLVGIQVVCGVGLLVQRLLLLILKLF